MLKKSIIFIIIALVLLMAVACSDNKKELTSEEQVVAFGNKIAQTINAKEYEKVCGYWSQAYVKFGEKQYKKSYNDLKKEYRVRCSNLNLEDASIKSIDIYSVSEDEKIYCMVMSVYYYNKYNKKCYTEETLYVFKEDDRFVFSDISVPIEDVIELSKSQYNFSSPVTENE